LFEKLLRDLKLRGYKVAAVKHAQDLELDKPGKDSWRLAKAGADSVWVSSPEGLFMHRPMKGDIKPEELVHFIGSGFDIIIIEGFKESQLPKIEVHRKEIGGELLFPSHQLLAVVSDEPVKTDAPVFPWDDVGKLTDLIVANFLSKSGGAERTALFINGLPVPLNAFATSVISKTIIGMVSALKGGQEAESITIHVDRESSTRVQA